MPNQRILFVNQEIAPYLPSSPSADLGKALPQAIHGKGCEVRTFMPKYGTVNERRNQLHEVIRLSGINIIIDDTDHPLIIKVASMQPSRIQVYFIDNDDYFQKSADDIDPVGSNRADNDERNIFFTRGTLETVRKLRWEPNIIHCSGLVSALIPMFIRTLFRDDPAFKDAKLVYSVLPGEFTTPLDTRFFDKLTDEQISSQELDKFKGLPLDSNLLHKMAVEYADGVIFHTESQDENLLTRIKERGIPFMQAPQEVNSAIYKDFYKSL